MKVRLARPDEREALEALQWRASLSNEGDRRSLLANPDAIVLPAEQIVAGQVFVAELRGWVAGFAAVLPREDGATELDGLFVEPEQFGNGVGRALVEHAVGWAREKGSLFLHVIGAAPAEGFYHRCGFETLGAAPTRFGPALAMRRAV